MTHQLVIHSLFPKSTSETICECQTGLVISTDSC